jgi:hypothetical protein
MADEYGEIPEAKIGRLFNVAGAKLKSLKDYCSAQSKEPIQFGMSSESSTGMSGWRM